MKIYKKTIIILIAILSVVFLSISFSKPAQAARWHRSVPTAIRGNYHNAKLKITVQIQKRMYIICLITELPFLQLKEYIQES